MRRKTSKLLTTVLALCMALALLPGAVFAAGSGKCGENATWTLDDDGHLTISGTGAIEAPENMYEEWGGAVKTIEVGNGVTELGTAVFQLGASATRAVLPETLTIIGEGAFYLESTLEEVNIPGAVTEIGDGAFFGCGSLTSAITLPDGLTAIGDMAFTGVPMTSITVPRSVTRIDEWALGYGSPIDSTYDGNLTVTPGFIIYGYAGTEAERYARDNDISFVALSEASGISVTVGGKAVEWADAAPFIDENDRTMVPLRAVADAMSLEVSWDSAAREASFTDGSKTIIFPIDSTTARTSDGGTVSMDTAAVISNDRTYAPIRYLAEFFGCEVGWDADTQTVVIK